MGMQPCTRKLLLLCDLYNSVNVEAIDASPVIKATSRRLVALVLTIAPFKAHTPSRVLHHAAVH